MRSIESQPLIQGFVKKKKKEREKKEGKKERKEEKKGEKRERETVTYKEKRYKS